MQRWPGAAASPLSGHIFFLREAEMYVLRASTTVSINKEGNTQENL